MDARARPRRYRLYFRLMDVMLVLSLIGFAEFVLDKVIGIDLFADDSTILPYLQVFFGIANFFVPTFLILARFMRDEYAELLWRRTATIMMYIAAIAPFCLFGLLWGLYFLASAQVGKSVSAVVAQELEFTDAVVVIWMIFMLLFVAIFQFLRWRDAR